MHEGSLPNLFDDCEDMRFLLLAIMHKIEMMENCCEYLNLTLLFKEIVIGQLGSACYCLK